MSKTTYEELNAVYDERSNGNKFVRKAKYFTDLIQ